LTITTDAKMELILKGESKNSKFCRICAYKCRSSQEKIEKHFRKYHKGEIAGFLKIGENPIKCIYENFNEWIKNPKGDLVEKAEYCEGRIGRPRKDQDQSATETVSDVSKGRPPIKKEGPKIIFIKSEENPNKRSFS
jgi:hypothetical protein